MTNFQTKCPHCQHTFKITQQQLELKNGLARCGNCKQIFSAKDNLLVSQADNKPLLKTTSVEPTAHLNAVMPVVQTPVIDARETVHIVSDTPNKSAQQEENVLLFDDQSGFDDEPVPNKMPLTSSDFSMDLSEEFEDFSHIGNDNSAYHVATSHDKPKKVEDESWLEELLEKEAIAEKNQSYLASNKIDSPSNVTDVSSLLTEFGVEVAEEKPLEQPEYQQRLNERLTHQPTSQQVAQREPIARNILWGIGSLLLLLGLGIQYAAFNQDTLIKNPDTAQTLRGICDGLHLPCDLAYADISAIDIKTLSFEGKDNSDIILSLTNRSSQSQLYPNLKITLQSNNTGVAQFIATPDQYLEDTSRALRSQQIKPIKLRVNFPRNKADQVVIDPFY